jgi:hypothetical protein
MTREERKQKLANAIKTYRGSYDEKTGKWIRPPQISKRRHIVNWLTRLGRSREQMNADAVAIDAFKNHDEFSKWMETI